MRLIDAEANIERLKKQYCEKCERRKCGKRKKYPIFGVACVTCGIMDAAEEMENAPTIDAAPVRRGHWEKSFSGAESIKYCSECGGASVILRSFNYCPYCGAYMKGDKE